MPDLRNEPSEGVRPGWRSLQPPEADPRGLQRPEDSSLEGRGAPIGLVLVGRRMEPAQPAQGLDPVSQPERVVVWHDAEPEEPAGASAGTPAFDRFDGEEVSAFRLAAAPRNPFHDLAAEPDQRSRRAERRTQGGRGLAGEDFLLDPDAEREESESDRGERPLRSEGPEQAEEGGKAREKGRRPVPEGPLPGPEEP